MKIKLCIYFMLSVILLSLEITSATHLVPLLVAGDGGSNYKCIDNEREALLHFKSHIQEDPYGSLSTWTTDEEDNCCEWTGITCHNQTGHVTELELSGYSLRGEIIPSLLNLSSLNLLVLSGNSFNGTIPSFIGSMTQLSHLDLSANSFNGTISSFIGSMTHLIHLDLSANAFTETVPSFISSMTELTYLSLSGNSFNGTIPMSIGSMTQLTYLDLSGNFFNGTIPTSIGSLTELMYLDLSYNSLLDGTIPPELGDLTNLQYLRLEGLVGCTIENIDWLSHLSQLQELAMSGTSLAKGNHWVNVISGLPKLSSLNLNECELSQAMHPYSSSPNSSSSSSIVSLYLRGNNLNSSMYHWLFPLTSNRLEELDISDNMLDGIPKFLGNLCNLTYLYLNNNSIAAKFPDLLDNLSGCTSITLQYLYASHNQLTGSLSDEIQLFSSLECLKLDDNKLNGTISEKVWELPLLQNLDLFANSLTGVISKNIGKSKLIDINLSGNSVEGVPSQAHMSNLSYVKFIDLSSCKLGTPFPNWIITLKNLTSLNIANTSISDIVPMEFWNMWPSQLTYLNLSSNNFSGRVPDLESNFNSNYSRIDLSSNNFYGPIPKIPSTLETLDLSKNRFTGGISFLCHIADGFLSFLDLSKNSLTGPVPDCLWRFTKLKVLNLGHNNLFGRLPASIESLMKLEVLFLNNNNFSGELPLSLQNCTNLNILDLGANTFSGYVPFWIGEKLSGLYALSLTTNNFFGSIPSQLCHLVNLQILDLSINNLNGTIPSCVTNLTAMVQDGLSLSQNVHQYTWGNQSEGAGISISEYVDHAMIKWQGIVREFSRTLGLVRSIDLSSNNLTGQIPYELTNLHQLLALNLSNNSLFGEIPQKIGEMKNLLIMDLSQNHLSGGIPSSMSKMTLLGYLDVSYNNLSGRIPVSTQLQSFEPSRYTGNADLCGFPLPKICPGDKDLGVPPLIGESKDDGKGIDELERWFYIGGATGFATGFWIVCSTLFLNRRGRHAFFRSMNSLESWVYVKVVVFIAKLKRVAHT